jgi:hypothetical protein
MWWLLAIDWCEQGLALAGAGVHSEICNANGFVVCNVRFVGKPHLTPLSSNRTSP